MPLMEKPEAHVTRCTTRKGTSLNRALGTAALGLFLGLLCFGCGSSTSKPTTPVPPDCQVFLDSFFDALKTKDVAKIQELCSYVPAFQSRDLPEESLNMIRESKKTLNADVFEKMFAQAGSFKSYSVAAVNISTVAVDNVAAANAMGAGIHVEIVCKTRFSKKKNARIGFHLLKETDESGYGILAWKYQVPL